MKKFLIYTGLVILMALFLSRCVISKMRWSDEKAYRVFRSRRVPLKISDTVIDGHHIHYAVSGSDTLPSLIFIHGSPGSWFHYMKFMWDDEMQKKFRIISIDRPGFGFSDYGRAMRLQEQCKLLLPVIKRLKTGRPLFICGHSYGAPVVAKLAADEPFLFRTIVLTGGSADPALEPGETWRQIMGKKPLSWFLPGAFQTSNTEILHLKEDLQLLAPELEKIRSNVIFIHGDEDKWVPIENIAFCKKMMKNAASFTCDTLKGAGHQIPWKRKEEFTRILLQLE